MICEKCGKEHDGSYGSGRFCCASCARSFSTSADRARINKKVSETLKARKNASKRSGLSSDENSNKHLKKSRKNKQRESRINELLKLVKTDDSMKFVTYLDIDFDDKYIVTSDGRVISVFTGYELHQGTHRDGYKYVCITDKFHKQHYLMVHRLVAISFIPNPNNYPIINHKDQNPANNNVNNLEWCTYTYNSTYGDAVERRVKSYKETLRRKGGQWNKGKKMK